jgi:hypothetical protein
MRFLILVFLGSSICAVPKKNNLPDWTMLVFAQANNNLSSFAMKNFSDMASIGSNRNFNALVQWYQPDIQGVWRYKIEQGKMVLDQCLKIDSDGTKSSDLIDSMRWAVTQYPAQKYSLVLWNHGIGIIDPVWGKMRPWEINQPRIGFAQEIIRENPRANIVGLASNEAPGAILSDFTSTTTCSLLDYVVTNTRGILFNEQSRTYMDNQTLMYALSQIKTSVLNNKKIDLLGMDACLMAMLEVGYLAKDVAEVLVASQEVELAQGWNYQALVDALNQKNSTTTSIAQRIISSYETMYKNRIPFFTQSAINLGSMANVTKALDGVIEALRACKNSDKSIVEIIRQARRSCQHFSSPNYIDLHSFLSDIQTSISDQQKKAPKKNRSDYISLQAMLAQGKQEIESAVFANTAGPHTARARGLSIYFPFHKIDDSYLKTTFAQESQWCSFLQEIIAG